MRHRKAQTRLKQKPQHARMLKRNLVTSILLYESVRTTRSRAKAVQPMIDRLINFAKTHEPHVSVRKLNEVVTDRNAARKIMKVYTERYKDRSSGLSRIVPVGVRKGDGAELVDLTLIDAQLGGQVEEEAKSKSASKSGNSKKSEASDTDKGVRARRAVPDADLEETKQTSTSPDTQS